MIRKRSMKQSGTHKAFAAISCVECLSSISKLLNLLKRKKVKKICLAPFLGFPVKKSRVARLVGLVTLFLGLAFEDTSCGIVLPIIY